MKTCVPIPLLALLLSLSALHGQQAPGWKGGAALPVSLVGLHQWTDNTLEGLCLDGSYQFSIPNTQAFIRPGLGVNLFPGKANEGRKTSLSNAQIFTDLVVPIKDGPLAILTGVSLNAWRQNTTGTWTRDYADTGTVAYEGKGSSNVQRPFGKFGYRLGLEYTLSKTLALAVVLQQTELGTDSEFMKDGQPYTGGSAVNPSWVQVGIRYAF